MFCSNNELWKPFYSRKNYLYWPTCRTICSLLNVCTCVLSTQSNWNRISWHSFLSFNDSWIIRNKLQEIRRERYGSYLCYWRKTPGQTCGPIKFTALCYVTQGIVVYTHKPFGKRMIFYTEDTGISLLQNVRAYSPIYMTSHPGRMQIWKLHASENILVCVDETKTKG